MSSLDIDAAIAAHTVWSKRLRFHIDGISSDQVEIAHVGDPAHCVLGRWLGGAGSDYALFSQYHELVDVHQEFHRIAAEVVRLHGCGELAAAEELLETRFTEASRKVVGLLQLLKVED